MIRKAVLSSLFVILASNWALAQPTADIDRLRAVLSRPPQDGVVDTALVFTNLGRSAAVVKVQAFVRTGEAAGSAKVEIPARGLAYVLASELRPESDAILGHAEAITRNFAIAGTAVLVGAGTTDLPVINNSVNLQPNAADDAATELPPPDPTENSQRIRFKRMTFPVIAAY